MAAIGSLVGGSAGRERCRGALVGVSVSAVARRKAARCSFASWHSLVGTSGIILSLADDCCFSEGNFMAGTSLKRRRHGVLWQKFLMGAISVLLVEDSSW